MTLQPWSLVQLGEVAELVNGDRGKNYPSQADRVSSGIPFINAGHLDAGVVRQESMDFISPQCYSALGSGRIQERDVLLCIRGSLGRVALADKDIVPGAIASSLVILRSRPKLEPRFLMAYLMSPIGKQMIAVHDNGSAQPNVGARDVAKFRLPLPPLGTQRKIASILSAYGELIENNTRRIQILEEMAQAVYREWFVEFRFPGHEDVRMVDSELGPIPEGWQIAPLFSLGEATFGRPFKSELFNKGRGSPLVRIRDIPRNATHTYTTEAAPERYRVCDGDILIGMDGDFHMCVWASGTALLNQRVVRFRPMAPLISRYQLFLALRRPIRHLNASIVGTTVAHLGKRHLAEVKLLLPPTDLARESAWSLDPLLELGIVLRKENDNLRETRDLLLPRLISGEIDVSNLDIGDAEPAA